MHQERRNLVSGLWVTALGTLASRVLGFARDVATAGLLGLGGGVMDALVIALRIPNLFRRLFGEGALAAGFVPVLSRDLHSDRRQAWKLISVMLVWLSAVLAAIVLLGEALLAIVWMLSGDRPGIVLVVELSATLLPYLWLICIAAQLSATLQALGRFKVPALAPAALNLAWLAGALWLAPATSENKMTQAFILAACILFSGVLQAAVQWRALVREGFRFDYDWPACRQGMTRIGRSLLPLSFGLAVTQVNTLADSLLAWGLSAPPGKKPGIAWLGGAWNYPLASGATAAIYYAERFYQLPVGLLGVALATVIFPLLSRHAARGDRRQLAGDLGLGLRLALFLGIPASVGLMLLAEPLSRLCFERGEFTADDTARTARLLGCYACGVWAYCAAPVLVRGFYALGDSASPVKVASSAVLLNVLLNISLVWPLAECGLALATSTSATLQVIVLAAWFSKRHAVLPWKELRGAAGKSVVSAAVMAAAVLVARMHIPSAGWEGAGALCGTCLAGALAYLFTAWLLRTEELSVLLGRTDRPERVLVAAGPHAADPA